jgi:hypothetical protein
MSWRPRQRPVDWGTCRPVTLPPELSAWRAAGEGRAVSVGQRGVILLDGVMAEPRRFRTVAAALRWVRE